MENKEFQFKTNLNCGGCVSKIQSDLDSQSGICEWKVDTNHKDKILTVKSEGTTKDEIISIVKNKGFNIESI